MKKINFNYGEFIYTEKLNNEINVYLYPTDKSKNFYATVSTHFGAEVMKYKKGSKVYNVTKGSAHFLEHRVMDFTKNKDAAKKINELGSIVNAYTTYNGTNYNIFGTEDILTNLTLIFDRVFKANIRKEDVESERGIILEEYYMYNSDPYYKAQTTLFKNLFNEGFLKYTVLGTEEGIKTVTHEELTRLYKDFYTPNNMFIVVTGNFDKDEVLKFIKEYMSTIYIKKSNAKVLRPREKEEVYSKYEEIALEVNEPKVVIGYKINIGKTKDKLKTRLCLEMLLSENFDKTGKAFLRLIENNLPRFEYSVEECDNFFIVYFTASTSEHELFAKIIDEELQSLDFNLESLNRKRKSLISGLILQFEDIVNVEDTITGNLFMYNKVINNMESIVKSITLKEIKNISNLININNKSLLIEK